jgi:hypothetical protein
VIAKKLIMFTNNFQRTEQTGLGERGNLTTVNKAVTSRELASDNAAS